MASRPRSRAPSRRCGGERDRRSGSTLAIIRLASSAGRTNPCRASRGDGRDPAILDVVAGRTSPRSTSSRHDAVGARGGRRVHDRDDACRLCGPAAAIRLPGHPRGGRRTTIAGVDFLRTGRTGGRSRAWWKDAVRRPTWLREPGRRFSRTVDGQGRRTTPNGCSRPLTPPKIRLDLGDSSSGRVDTLGGFRRMPRLAIAKGIGGCGWFRPAVTSL